MPANFQPLTPLRFLERSAAVFPDKLAIVCGERRYTYREFADEATRVAQALQASGIEPGDRVAYLCPNVAEMLIAHFAVPLSGGVLVALNVRLSPGRGRLYLPAFGSEAPDRRRGAAAEHARRRKPRRRRRADRGRRLRFDVGRSGEGALPQREYEELRLPRKHRAAALDGRGRAGDHLDQLHVGDDRRPQGRGIQPPGRVPQLARRGHPFAALVVLGLPLDPADVPLQRLVHDLGGNRCRRNARLPASRPARRDLATDGRGGRDPSQRRTGRDDVDRAGARGAPVRARGDDHDSGRGAEPDDDRGARSARRSRDPRLWAHRGLRAVLGVRMAAGVAGA